jgi:spermidine synthase
MKTTAENRVKPILIHLVIFLAGFTFLIYEVSWNRLLSLVLGTTVTASTIVLASFMAGFGVGAFIWGRFANRRTRIENLLAILLGGIGLFSAINYFLITVTIPSLYAFLAGSGLSNVWIELIVFGLTSGFLFIPAFLMGGVFPLVSKLAVGSSNRVASTLGRLYALETLGSTIGGLLTGFLFLGALGQMNTLILAVAINLSLAIWLFLTNQYNQLPEKELPSVKSKHKDLAEKSDRIKNIPITDLRRTALIGAFICGFSILSLQMIWIRILRIYLTNTSYTFAMVSSLVILGLFTGSYLFKRTGERIGNHQHTMIRVIILMGVTTGFGLVLLIYLPQILMFPFQSALENPFARVLLLPFIAAILIIYPPAVFSGFAFPLACSMYTTGRKSISEDVGFVLMINTIGSVIGPIAAAFFLIPLLGVSVSVLLIISLLAGAALFILFGLKQSRQIGLVRNILLSVMAILFVVIILRPDIRILPPSFSRFDREVLFYRESVEGTLSVGQDRGAKSDTKYTYVNNSAVIGSTYDAVKVVKMVGHFPFFLGLECKDVLVIGFGIGVTTSAIASHPEVESIECVELVKGLEDAAVYYIDLNLNVINDPRLKMISGDGRHYLQMTQKKYDLISCDPTHPILGSGNLYTKEYFAMCKEHLNPEGMVSQYLPLHKLRTEELMGIIHTFRSEFPNCTVWLGHFHAVLLGSMNPIEIEFPEWATNIGHVSGDEYFYSDPYHLAATLVLDGKRIEQLTTESKINSDNKSYTEFFAPACLDQSNIARNLRFFMDNRVNINTVFSNINNTDRMARFEMGNNLLTESLFYKWSGDTERSLETLREACRVNPEDQEYPFLIKFAY